MVISSPCLTDIKNWLVQKQTAFGKDFSNPFIADSLLKTIWFSAHHASHAPCYSNEALAITKQTATGKEISNPFMAGEDCWVLEDFTTYCCWFNIGAASEDLMLLRKIEKTDKVFSTVRVDLIIETVYSYDSENEKIEDTTMEQFVMQIKIVTGTVKLIKHLNVACLYEVLPLNWTVGMVLITYQSSRYNHVEHVQHHPINSAKRLEHVTCELVELGHCSKVMHVGNKMLRDSHCSRSRVLGLNKWYQSLLRDFDLRSITFQTSQSQIEIDPYVTSTLNSTKLPILDTGKFKQWKFRIQQYLQHKHYALWEVIKFGDSYRAPAQDKSVSGEATPSSKSKGRTVAITAEDMQKRRNDVNERT
ncbi:hypothetical protein Tco_0390450, partial [Tanacetum coccineum]